MKRILERLNGSETILDLGCGPGNSTAVLKLRWPSAHVVGLDSSPAMIEVASRTYPNDEWVLGDIASWRPQSRFDLVFSNAALQWMPHHAALVRRLFDQVAVDGALAFQIPSDRYALVRDLIDEVADDPVWRERMAGPRSSLTMHSPAFYYDVLAGSATRLDIWETEYHHVLESPEAIVEWMSSTGLRPFLGALDSEEERELFVAKLTEKVVEGYSRRVDGKVLFPFRRLFVIAYR